MDKSSGSDVTSTVTAPVKRHDFAVLITEPMLVRRLRRLEAATADDAYYFPNRGDVTPTVILPLRDTQPPVTLHIMRIVRHKDVIGFLWYKALGVSEHSRRPVYGGILFRNGTAVRVTGKLRRRYSLAVLGGGRGPQQIFEEEC